MSKTPTLLVPGSLRAAPGVFGPDTVPVAHVTSWLSARLPENGGRSAAIADRVLVVRAETGSGKSTILPVAVFRILRSERTPPQLRFRGAGVICTQPRVLTAVALAGDVSSRPWNPDMVIGKTVGYQTGPISQAPPSGLTYATAGTLAVQLQLSEDADIMDRYRFILVDEAHERSLDSDTMLMMLRNFYVRNEGNPKLPFLLLLSATLRPARYTEYFGIGPENVFDIAGRAYKVSEHWPSVGTNDYAAEAAKTAIRIHEEHPDDAPERADILIFVPGSAEAVEISRQLEVANKRYLPTKTESKSDHAPFIVLNINREVIITQAADFEMLFVKPSALPAVGGVRPARRIIVATIVAETGLTIDTLRYVIDCGWNRSREMYHPWGAEGIVTRPAPRSRIAQRRGRAGRLFDGDYYPLYTENVYGALDEDQLPDVLTIGVDSVFPALVAEQQRQKLRTGEVPEFRVEHIGLLDPPPPEAYMSASATASALGLISPRARLPSQWPPELQPPESQSPEPQSLEEKKGFGLTTLGFICAKFARTAMEGVRILLAGYQWGAAASDLVTIVATFGTSPMALLEPPRRPGDPRPPPPPPPPGADQLPPIARAMKAALPPFLAHKLGGGDAGARPPTENETYYFRARLLISDDFIETLLIFDAFSRQVSAERGDAEAIESWCAGLGLSFAALVALARRRDEIIEEMISAGLNPFRNSEARISVSSFDTFTDTLVRLKKCLYAGLRMKLLRYVDDGARGPGYYTRQGLPVETPPLLSDKMANRLYALQVTETRMPKPRWLITDRLRLLPVKRSSPKEKPPFMYTVDSGLVSVLDGYVYPDPGADEARKFWASKSDVRKMQPPLPGSEPEMLEAYERAARAVSFGRDGPLQAPAGHLKGQIRAALFTPQTDAVLLKQLSETRFPRCRETHIRLAASDK